MDATAIIREVRRMALLLPEGRRKGAAFAVSAEARQAILAWWGEAPTPRVPGAGPRPPGAFFNLDGHWLVVDPRFRPEAVSLVEPDLAPRLALAEGKVLSLERELELERAVSRKRLEELVEVGKVVGCDHADDGLARCVREVIGRAGDAALQGLALERGGGRAHHVRG